jgi:hypothetical protein
MFFAEDYTVRACRHARKRVSIRVSLLISLTRALPALCSACSQVAAATGFQVWEGARAVVKLLEEDGSTLSACIAGKRVLELGSGTGLAGLCASVIGGDVLLSGLC